MLNWFLQLVFDKFDFWSVTIFHILGYMYKNIGLKSHRSGFHNIGPYCLWLIFKQSYYKKPVCFSSAIIKQIITIFCD